MPISRHSGSVQLDGIDYFEVVIPPGAKSMRITIYLDDKSLSLESAPIAFVKYNGLPTISKYDAQYLLPMRSPLALEILDNNPMSETLYIGIWGGVTPNSFKYFAGTPALLYYSADVEIETCSSATSSSIRPNTQCNDHLELLGASFTGAHTHQTVALNEPRDFGITIPSGLESLHVRLYELSKSLDVICRSMKRAVDSKALSPDQGYILAAQLYTDHPDLLILTDRIRVDADVFKLCFESNSKSDDDALTLALIYPRGGLWTLRLEVYSVSPSTRDAALAPASAGLDSAALDAPRRLVSRVIERGRRAADHVNSRSATQSLLSGKVKDKATEQPTSANIVELHLNISYFTCPTGSTGGDQKALKRTYTINLPGYTVETDPQIPDSSLKNVTSTREVTCQTPVTDLISSYTCSASQGILSYQSSDTAIRKNWYVRESNTSAAQVTLDSAAAPSAAFIAPMDGISASTLRGGTMQFQLRIRRESLERGKSRAELYNWLRGIKVSVAVRVGGHAVSHLYPGQSVDHGVIGDAKYSAPFIDSGSHVYSSNARNSLWLSSETATIIEEEDATSSEDKRNGASDDSQSESDDIRDKGALERLADSLGLGGRAQGRLDSHRSLGVNKDKSDSHSASGSEGLLLVWTLLKPVMVGLTGSSDNTLYALVSSDSDQSLIASLGILIQPCSSSSCVHGDCVVRHDEISYATCECHFPYAGEDCSIMSIPYHQYVTQVVVLVASNLPVVFGAILAASSNMKVFAMVLTLSAISSSMYHVCDMDFYCFNLGFHALQSFDIMFSTLCVASMILHYSPVNAESHATLMILMIGLLAGPIIENPTALWNILYAIMSSVCLCLCAWLHTLCCRSFQCQCCRQVGAWLCCECFRRPKSFSRAPPSSLLELVSSHAPQKGLSSIRNSIGSMMGRHEAGQFRPLAQADHDHDSENNALARSDENADDGMDDLDRLIYRNAPAAGESIQGGEIESSVSPCDGREWEEEAEKVVINEDIEWSKAEVSSSSANSTSTESDRVAKSVGRAASSVSCGLLGLMFELRWTGIGALLAAGGVAAFAMQTKDNYYIAHSVWHFLAMLSACPLIYGRGVAMRRVCAAVGIALTGPASRGEPGY